MSDLYLSIKISADTKTYHEHVLRMHKQIMKQQHQFELVGVMYEPNPFSFACLQLFACNLPNLLQITLSLHCKFEIITIKVFSYVSLLTVHKL